MTFLPALTGLLAASTKKTTSSASSTIFFLVLIALAVAFYFFFYKPQQRKVKDQRAQQGSGIEVGDEVQTIGGVIGTVLEVNGDRYTVLTGALNEDGNLDGPQPTRIVFVRQAIARKVEPLAPANPADADPDVSDVSGASGASDLGDVHGSNGTGHEDAHDANDGPDPGEGASEA
ncbi:MAG: preprotein translocase subunit YajC [Acidimicrobiales bacterium]